MGQVTLTLNGRSYRVGCGDGQEERLAALSAHVADKLESVVREFGQVGEARLFLLASLLIADELFDSRTARDTAASTAAAAALREIAERARPEMRPPKPAKVEKAAEAPAPALAPAPVTAAAPAPPRVDTGTAIAPQPAASAEAAAPPKPEPRPEARAEPKAEPRPEDAAKPVSSLQAAINRSAPPEARKAGG